jgi:hypothetical protein
MVQENTAYVGGTMIFSNSVVDPDPYVFGPPGSGSVNILYGYGVGSESGSFYQQAKKVRKTLISPF